MANRNGQASAENIEDDFVQTLMREADTVSFTALLRKAYASGHAAGEASARLRLLAQLQSGNGANGVMLELPAAGASGASVAPLNDGRRKPRNKTVKGVVKCPYPNCKAPGIRPMSNFCQNHYNTLKPAQRDELRQKQIEEKEAAKKKKPPKSNATSAA